MYIPYSIRGLSTELLKLALNKVLSDLRTLFNYCSNDQTIKMRRKRTRGLRLAACARCALNLHEMFIKKSLNRLVGGSPALQLIAESPCHVWLRQTRFQVCSVRLHLIVSLSPTLWTVALFCGAMSAHPDTTRQIKQACLSWKIYTRIFLAYNSRPVRWCGCWRIAQDAD